MSYIPVRKLPRSIAPSAEMVSYGGEEGSPTMSYVAVGQSKFFSDPLAKMREIAQQYRMTGVPPADRRGGDLPPASMTTSMTEGSPYTKWLLLAGAAVGVFFVVKRLRRGKGKRR